VSGSRPLEERVALARTLWVDEFGGRDDPDARVRMGLATEEPEMVGLDGLAAQIDAGRSLGVPVITAHVNCKPDRATGAWPAQIAALADAGLLGPDVVLSHVNMTSDEEWERMRAAGAHACATPETEFKSGMGRTCLRAETLGLRPALGIDLVGYPSGDLFTAMRLGLATERLLRNTVDHNDVHPADALGWATTNGAEAVGLGDRLGVLAPGRLADVVVIDATGIGFAGFDRGRPVNAIVAQAHPWDIESVIVGGDVVKRDHRLVADVASVVADAHAAAAYAYGARGATEEPVSLRAYYRS
jgi:cytosine/adenosine deaminase-related metal-dependent hydrolase